MSRRSSGPWRRPRTAPSPPGVAHIPLAKVFGRHARARRPAGEPSDPATVDEVVYIAAAPGGGQGFVDIRHRYAERAGLGVVDVEEPVRACPPVRWAAPRPGACPARPCPGTGCAPPAGVVAETRAVLQLDGETTRGAEFDHRRRNEGEHHGLADLREGRHGTAGNRLDIGAWRRALIPGRRFLKPMPMFWPLPPKLKPATGTARTYRVLRLRESVSTFRSTARARSWVAPAGNITWLNITPGLPRAGRRWACARTGNRAPPRSPR